MVEWNAERTPFFSWFPKFQMYTSAGRFREMYPYLHHSHLPPQLPALYGTFIVIHLLECAEGFNFKLAYFVLNGRPPSAPDGPFSQNGELYKTCHMCCQNGLELWESFI